MRLTSKDICILVACDGVFDKDERGLHAKGICAIGVTHGYSALQIATNIVERAKHHSTDDMTAIVAVIKWQEKEPIAIAVAQAVAVAAPDGANEAAASLTQTMLYAKPAGSSTEKIIYAEAAGSSKHKVEAQGSALTLDQILREWAKFDEKINAAIVVLFGDLDRSKPGMAFIFNLLWDYIVLCYTNCNGRRETIIKAAAFQDAKIIELKDMVCRYRENTWLTMPLDDSIGKSNFVANCVAAFISRCETLKIVNDKNKQAATAEIQTLLNYAVRFCWTLVCFVPQVSMTPSATGNQFDSASMTSDAPGSVLIDCFIDAYVCTGYGFLQC